MSAGRRMGRNPLNRKAPATPTESPPHEAPPAAGTETPRRPVPGVVAEESGETGRLGWLQIPLIELPARAFVLSLKLRMLARALISD